MDKSNLIPTNSDEQTPLIINSGTVSNVPITSIGYLLQQLETQRQECSNNVETS